MKIARMICVVTAFVVAGATAQEGGKNISNPAISQPGMKTTINFATATPGGGFPLYGNAFAEVINAADPTFSIEPRNTKGSNENIPLLERARPISPPSRASRPTKPSWASGGRAPAI